MTRWGLVALTAFWASWAHGADEWGEIHIPKDGAIKVGLGATLAGPLAALGAELRAAAEMALSAKGQIHGHRVVLQAENDGCEGAPAVALAERFCKDPTLVGVIGYLCSDASLPASEIHDKHKIVMISPASTHPELTAREFKVVFRTCWNDRIQAKAGAELAVRNKWTRVAVIHERSAYGQGLAEAFKRDLEAGGGKAVVVSGFNRGETEFPNTLGKIKAQKPQLVYFAGTAAEGTLFARQMSDAGLKVRLLTGDGCLAPREFAQAAGKAASGALVTAVRTPEGPALTEWTARFEERHGPRRTFSPHAFDAANLLLEAVEKAAQRKPDNSLVIGKKALRDAVAAARHQGVTGTITFDAQGDRTSSVVVFQRVVCEKEECRLQEPR
jgi:branched-chain amino acid transport system substrate-binding protein